MKFAAPVILGLFDLTLYLANIDKMMLKLFLLDVLLILMPINSKSKKDQICPQILGVSICCIFATLPNKGANYGRIF